MLRLNAKRVPHCRILVLPRRILQLCLNDQESSSRSEGSGSKRGVLAFHYPLNIAARLPNFPATPNACTDRATAFCSLVEVNGQSPSIPQREKQLPSVTSVKFNPVKKVSMERSTNHRSDKTDNQALRRGNRLIQRYKEFVDNELVQEFFALLP